MIPVMLATGFSMALIPLVTKYFTMNQHKQLSRTLDQTFQILYFLTLPAVVGMTVLANELYHLFYEQSAVGSDILAHYLPVAILFSLFPVTASILQGINQQKWIILNLLVGLLIKLALNIPLIGIWETNGAIAATIIGYSVAIFMNFAVLVVTQDYRSKLLVRRIALITSMNIIMLIVVAIVRMLLLQFMPAESKFGALLIIIIVGLVGAFVYGAIGIRIGIAQKLFGERLTKYTKKFGF
jgi:O-antigen/teichoic acid export membrane protein